MNSTKQHAFRVVAASFDHGKTFPQVSALVPRKRDSQWAASYARWIGTPVPAPPPARYSG